MAGSRNFVYTEILDESQIRVLRLHPGSSGAPLRCTLELRPTHSRENADTYEAISYACGSLPSRSTIQCNGKKLNIRPSLYGALQRFRDPDRDRLLWADQICINQQSDREKSAQVSIMKDIFELAQRVLVWLGADEQRQAVHFDRLMSIARRQLYAGFGSGGEKFQSNAELAAVGLPPQESPEWNATKEFLRLSYLTRTWVVQEILLGREVIASWGDTNFEWRHLVEPFRWFAKNLGVIGSKGINFSTTVHLMNLQRPPLPLSDLMTVTQDLDATDMRDKVFALLGLHGAPRNLQQPYKADYSKPIDQVRYEVTKYIIEEEQSLEVLSRAVPTNDELSLPGKVSWAMMIDPMTTKLAHNTPFPRHLLTRFVASGAFKPRLGAAQGDTLLSLEGIRLSAVRHVSAVLGDEKDVKGMIHAWATFQSSIDALGAYRGIRKFIWTLLCGQALSSTTSVDAATGAMDLMLLGFAKAILRVPLEDAREPKELDMDTWHEYHARFQLITYAVQAFQAANPESYRGEIVPISKTFGAAHKDWIRRKISPYFKRSARRRRQAVDACFDSVAMLTDMNHFAFKVSLFQTAFKRALFVMEDGKVGLGPAATKKGDVVAVLFGGPTPYVLRPSQGAGNHRFVGECYVKEYIDGQAIGLMEQGKLRREWFVLH